MEILTSFPEIGDYSYVNSIQSGCLKGSWRVVSKKTQEQFALQTIAKSSLNSSEANSRFQSQLYNMKQADNRYIAAFIELIDDPSAFHIITEIPEGKSLKDYVTEKGPMPRELVQDLIGKLIFVQKYLNSKLGVKFCEFNPNTIYVDDSGSLTRYCISLTLPQNDSFLAHFVPPEIFTQNKIASSSDSWSLGMIVYFCITGTLPFDCKTEQEIMKKILNEKISIPPSLPEDISLILSKTLVKNSLMRMGITDMSASEFLSTFVIEDGEMRNERRSSSNSNPQQLSKSKSGQASKSQSDVNKHLVHLSYKANINSVKKGSKKNLGNLG